MNRYSLAILILSVAIAALSVWKGDWNWLIVAIIGLAVVYGPIRATGDSSCGYDERLMSIAVLPLVGFILLFTVNQFFNFKHYYLLSISIQACANMAYGVMIAVFLNARTEVSLSRRWTVLFALIFACSLSVLFMFFTVFWMSSVGYPLYNDNFSNALENDNANMALMLPMMVTAFATIIYAVIFNEYLKRMDFPGTSQPCAGGRI